MSADRSMLGRLSTYLGGEAAWPIVVLFLLNAADELDSRTFDVLGPEIADHFGVGVGTFGIVTVLVIVLAPLISVPIAHLSDRGRRMPYAVGGAVAWGAFSLATGLAPTLVMLIAFRAGSGFGKVVNSPVHGALIGDFYSPRTRAKAFGVHNLANYAGQLVASVAAGVIAQAFGWQVPFVALAIPTILIVLVARRLPEPERGRFERDVLVEEEQLPLRQAWRRLRAIRSLRYQWYGLAFAGGALLGLGVLVPFYLEEDFGVGPAGRGFIIGAGAVVSAVAVVVGTARTQVALDRSPRDGLLLVCWTGIAITVGLALAALAPTLWLAVPMIWAITAAVAYLMPALYAVTALVAPPRLRGTAFAIAGLVALGGSVFAIAGFIIGDIHGVRWAMVVMTPVLLRGVLLFFTATRYVDDDVARLDPRYVERARADGDGVLLQVESLRVSYGGVQVLFGVDLEVHEGEIVALLGTNGAGKSTTLNAISGVVEPDGGNVFFAGEAITGEPPELTVARGLVQVPGGRGIFPGLTVEDNLKMGAFLLRRDRALVRQRMDDIYTLFPRLAERREQRAGSLSGGERQMLTLAQTFLLRPRLMLIDELSLGLAPAVVGELLETVRGMNRAGTTIVIVEQSVNVALTLADRAYFLEKGEVRFSGPTAELLERGDLLRSVFLEGAAAGLAGT